MESLTLVETADAWGEPTVQRPVLCQGSAEGRDQDVPASSLYLSRSIVPIQPGK